MSDVQANPRWSLILLVFLHVAFATWYAMNTPYRTAGILMSQRTAEGPAKVPDVGAPDERQHANYVQHVLEGRGIPILDPKDPNLGETYQSHQPPLYYLLAAGTSKILGISDVNDPGAIRLRLLNVVIGAVTVAGAFFLGLWGFKNQAIALAAAAFVALLPMNLALSGAISNDPLLYALCTWTLALAARCLQDGWSSRRAVTLGLLAGFAVVTKTTGIALAPILLYVLWASNPKVSLAQVGWGLAGYFGLVAPWVVRNLNVYGDPFAIKAFNQAFVGSPQASVFIEGFGPMAYWTQWVGWWTARSFFGVFGYMDVFLNETGRASSPQETGYRLLCATMLLAVMGWLLATLRGKQSEAAKVQWMNGIFLGIILLLFMRFNLQYFQGQARYLFPALGVIGCGVGVALSMAKKPMIAVGALAVGLLCLNLYTVSILPGEFAKRTEVARPL